MVKPYPFHSPHIDPTKNRNLPAAPAAELAAPLCAPTWLHLCTSTTVHISVCPVWDITYVIFKKPKIHFYLQVSARQGTRASRRASTCTTRCTSATAGRDSFFTPTDTIASVSTSNSSFFLRLYQIMFFRVGMHTAQWKLILADFLTGYYLLVKFKKS